MRAREGGVVNRRELVLLLVAGGLAAVLILLWVRPSYSPFYEALLPYDLRNDIRPGGNANEVMDALNRIVFMLGQADADNELLETDAWHARWRVHWTTVFEATEGGLQATAVTCLRYGETRLTSDLLACIEQAQALRE
jgi:hypothetical protein